jgi:two-component system, NarL family, response regulator DesR
MSEMIRILLAEDMTMVRGALLALLEMEPDIEVVAEVRCGDDILPQALLHRPDVAVLDIDLPGIDGLTAAELLHEQLPDCRCLMLTSLARSGNLRRAMAAHVSGFILKDAPPDKLADGIRGVAAGRRMIDPQMAFAAWDSSANPLTEREIEVLRLTADGAEPTEVANQLCLTPGTVRNYLTTTVTKLNARNRIDAIRIAQQAGWM